MTCILLALSVFRYTELGFAEIETVSSEEQIEQSPFVEFFCLSLEKGVLV